MEKVQKTIIDYIKELNVGNDNITAFESLGGSTINYKTFFELVDNYAKAFKEVGVKNGDVVTICTGGTLDTVLYFAGLNKIGAVSQFVNPNYFKFNSKKYINETNSKLLICLDKFYPAIRDEIAETNVEQVILSSISEYSSFLFKKMARRIPMKDIVKVPGIKYMSLPEFVKMGIKSNISLEPIKYEQDKPAVIVYTSGTTGNPKGVVHTNDSLNNMLSIYQIANGFGASRAAKNLVLIPPMYLTSFMHSIIGPASVGATNTLQPIYNPKTLAEDIKKYEPKTVVASKAHYINLEDSKLPEGSLNKTKYAYCGGEAISRDTAIRINRILTYLGIEPMINCYGESEFGTMVMFNYDIPNRVNESGILIPEVKAKILDLVTGLPVEPGKRGELYIQTPAVMKEYYNNPEATAKFFVVDNNGEKWAKTGDIAEIKYQQNGKDVYEVSGRVSDSFIDENGEVVYLFDIENQVEKSQYVREAEVISLTIDGKKVPIVHIVLNKEINITPEEALKSIDDSLRKNVTKNQIPYAYKIRESFATSPISGKRDYAILKYETNDYLMLNEFGNFEAVNIDSLESKEINDLVHSKILIKKQ